MTTTDDRPAVTITHPDWCGRALCEQQWSGLSAAHVGTPAALTTEHDDVTMTVQPGRFDEEPDRPAVPLVVLH